MTWLCRENFQCPDELAHLPVRCRTHLLTFKLLGPTADRLPLVGGDCLSHVRCFYSSTTVLHLNLSTKSLHPQTISLDLPVPPFQGPGSRSPPSLERHAERDSAKIKISRDVLNAKPCDRIRFQPQKKSANHSKFRFFTAWLGHVKKEQRAFSCDWHTPQQGQCAAVLH